MVAGAGMREALQREKARSMIARQDYLLWAASPCPEMHSEMGSARAIGSSGDNFAIFHSILNTQ